MQMLLNHPQCMTRVSSMRSKTYRRPP